VALAARGGAEADDDDEYEYDEDYIPVSSMSMLSVGKELEGVVTRVQDRIVLVDVGVEKEGLVPISKLLERGRVEHPSEAVKEGDSVKVWVVEVEQAENIRQSKLILSMAKNKVLDQRNLGPQADLAEFKDVESTEWLDGLVVNKQDFGTFVSVKSPTSDGRAQGLVYITEVKEGGADIAEPVKVRVLSVDPERNRMSLSMKEPAPPRGDTADLEPFKTMDKGVWIEGVVKSLQDFGAFVEVAPPGGGQPVSGLVHLTQIKEGFVEDPAEELEVDQTVKVRVLEVNDRGLSLSMKEEAVEPVTPA